MNKSRTGLRAIFATVLFAALAGVVLSGCSHAVKHTVDDSLRAHTPHTVAVLPVEWNQKVDKRDREVAHIFRKMTDQKLRTLSYKTPTLESIDDLLKSKGLDGRRPEAIAQGLGTDAVLIVEITDWESNVLLTYAYLKLKARFTLFSNKGTKLWSAEYSTAESDIRLDKESMELAVITVYEPRIQRFINDVFSTLPVCNASEEHKEYFNWLP